MTQASLLKYLASEEAGTAGLAGLVPSMRAEMNRVASEYEPGRKMLAEAISKIAQREGVTLGPTGAKSITEEALNKLLQSTDAGRDCSLKLTLCFCLATGDFSPLRPVFKLAGLVVIPKEDLRFLEYGKTCDALKKAREQKKKLEARL